MNAGELALIYAYVLATNFLESLLVLSAPVILSFILPPKWFRDLFVARGTSLVIFGLGYAMLLASQFQNRDDYPGVLLKVWSVALAIGVIVLLVFVAGKTPFIKRAVEVIAEHATIFLYVYVPLSLISLIVVLPRIL